MLLVSLAVNFCGLEATNLLMVVCCCCISICKCCGGEPTDTRIILACYLPTPAPSLPAPRRVRSDPNGRKLTAYIPGHLLVIVVVVAAVLLNKLPDYHACFSVCLATAFSSHLCSSVTCSLYISCCMFA